ncbi:MAG: NGG1p interacting factor NIF3 [Sphaerochaetaceae bacterium]|jgi:hypothetical protein|nr:NGG1p interacting factor NIF3 [Sphaerochaetaceae bacterium]MDX9938828.1 NGG1p interacting factor NIF3 [Sphaerochaetaceae bacterium]
MYMLVFHVPVTHSEQVKKAVFAAGAGRMDKYEQCCWQVLGTGQFIPAEGSDPFVGTQGNLEVVEEYRIETVVDEFNAARVIKALLDAHPYEVPSYHLIPVLTLEHPIPN